MLVAACSAGSGSGMVPPAAGNGTDAARAGLARGSIVLHIPLNIDAVHAHFISPSTKSAEIEIKPAAGCGACTPAFTQFPGLTATSQACSFKASGITCVIPLTLKTGTYDGALSTFDGAPKCYAAKTCHELSTNGAFKIDASGTTVKVPAITLQGVPSSLTWTVLDGGTFVQRVGSSIGSLGASQKGRILVTPYDADGNAILGPGMPKFAASIANGWAASTSGNVVLVQSPAKMSGGQTQLTITTGAPGCKAAPTNCKLTLYMGFNPFVAAAQKSANSVTIFPSHQYHGSILSTVTRGISQPFGLAFDPSGNLYVANGGTGNVTEYAQPWNGAPVATYKDAIGTGGVLATSPSGLLAVGNATTGVVTVFKPPSAVAVATISLGHAPSALYFDGSENLWVGSSGLIGRYASPYKSGSNLQLTAGGNGIGLPVGMGIDVDGNLDVADSANNRVVSFTKPYTGAAASTFADPGVDFLAVYYYDVVVCGSTQLNVLDPASLTPGMTQGISDSTPQICAIDGSADLYDTDTAYNGVGEWDNNTYVYFGEIARSLQTPTALAAFP